MTRKDYIAIAAALKVARESHAAAILPGKAYDLCNFVAWQIANVMAADNPRFDRDKFLQSCGIIGSRP